MRKMLYLIVLLPAFAVAQNSTSYWSLGLAVDTLNYSGEITQEGDIGTWINEMRPDVGIQIRRHLNYRTAFGIEAGWGKVYAADANRGNQERDYIVDTELAQVNMFFELNFKKYGKYFQRNANTPFVKVGIGGLFYTPFLNTNASYPQEYELFPGSYATYNFQLGFGWKWRISYHSSLALDLHYNATGSSYLEGFNLRDAANPTDAFYGLRLTYSYAFFE